jgi:hypothetical protein
MADGEQPRPGSWNRIYLTVDDINAEVGSIDRRGRDFPQRHRERPGWFLGSRAGSRG